MKNIKRKNIIIIIIIRRIKKEIIKDIMEDNDKNDRNSLSDNNNWKNKE